MFDSFEYHKSLKHLHVGCEVPRAYFIPYGSENAAQKDNRAESENFISLCGDWDFHYYPSISKAPDFLAEGFTTDGFDKMTVPRSWQTVLGKGYDVPHYSDVRYPIPVDPPHVPAENPCGLYVRTLVLDEAFLQKEIYVNFEGVDSCFYLFVNDVFAGYSQVSHCTSEIKITHLLHGRENTFKVLVFKWCDGTYLEDQDKYRLSGIFREVYLLARDRLHIEDIYARTAVCEDFSEATVTLDLSAKQPLSYEYRLLSPDGEEIAAGVASTDQKPLLTIANPTLWNDETPRLYTLTLHCGSEYICLPLALKDIRIKDRVIYINGKKVKAKGANRHDSHPILGAATPMDHMLRDLYLMKQHNINTVRASHYPNDPRFLTLCDKLGFYVVDETDLETHGMYDVKNWDLLSNDPLWQEAYLDRCQRMFERDKNHGCIIMWSLGNESGVGQNQIEMYRYLHRRMPGAIVHCEDLSRRYTQHKHIHYPTIPANTTFYEYDACADVMSFMYWPTEDCLNGILKNKSIRQPLFLCEYAHSMGNGPGDLKEYWDLIYKHDAFFGGCIWEFTDHAIPIGEDRLVRPKYTYGGDFGEYPHEENFCVDGMVYPDRRPHSGLLEYKQAIKPFSVRLIEREKAVIRLKNLRYFTSLSDLSLVWSFTQRGKKCKEGFIPSVSVQPQRAKSFALSLDGVDLSLGGELLISLRQNTSTPWSDVGYEVGFEQFVYAEQVQKPSLSEKSVFGQPIAITEDKTRIVVTAADTAYTFDKQLGLLISLSDNGREMLSHPMTPTIWRAPTDNDRKVKSEWFANGFHHAQTNCYDLRVIDCDKRHAVLQANLSMAAPGLLPFVQMTVNYTVWQKGGLMVDVLVATSPTTFATELPFLPRFGFTFRMPEENERLRYFGKGETESYRDKNLAAKKGVFETTVSKHFEPYIRPQENMAHVDTDWMAVSNLSGQGLYVLSTGKAFSFNCSHFTTKQLTETPHDYELCPLKDTVVHVDYAHSGIGSNSCGPVLAQHLRVAEKEISFSFRLLPARINDVDPFEEFGRK